MGRWGAARRLARLGRPRLRQLSIQASTRAGVAFTNYTPAGGLVVGVRDKADVSQVDQWLRSQPAVLSVEQVPLPSGLPASTPKTVPTC